MFWNKKEGESALPDMPNAPDTSNTSDLNQSFNKKPAVQSAAKEEEEEEDLEKHALPSFPDSPLDKGFSQAAIKDAVSNDSPEERLIPLKNNEKNFKTVEMNESFSKTSETITPSISQVKQNQKEHLTQQISETPNMTLSSKNQTEPQTSEELSPIPEPPKLIITQQAQPEKINPSIRERKDEAAMLPQKYFKKPESKESSIFVKIDKFYSAKKALDETKNQLNQIEELLKKIREIKLREEQELETWERELLTAKSRIQDVTENIFEKTE